MHTFHQCLWHIISLSLLSLSLPPSLPPSLSPSLLPSQSERCSYENCDCEHSSEHCILVANCQFVAANNYTTAIKRISETLQNTPNYEPGNTYYFASGFTIIPQTRTHVLYTPTHLPSFCISLATFPFTLWVSGCILYLCTAIPPLLL